MRTMLLVAAAASLAAGVDPEKAWKNPPPCE